MKCTNCPRTVYDDRTHCFFCDPEGESEMKPLSKSQQRRLAVQQRKPRREPGSAVPYKRPQKEVDRHLAELNEHYDDISRESDK